MLLIGAVVAFAAGGLMAQDAPAASAAAGMSFKQVMAYGGWVLYVIIAMSVFALAAVMVLLFNQRVARVAPRSLVRDVVDHIRGGAAEDAYRLCEDNPCAFSDIAMSALNCIKADPDAETDLIKDIITGEGSRQAERIQGQPHVLVDVTAVAPMLGLLGTVIGMLTAFSAVADDVAAAKPVLLAQGVSRALITTIAGLFVAIPSHIAYAWFRRGASRLTARLETAAQELLSAIVHNRQKA